MIQLLTHIRLFTMILNVAVKDGVLKTNPCTGAIKELNRKYSGTVKEVRALTGTEQAAFDEYLSRPGTYHYLFPLFKVNPGHKTKYDRPPRPRAVVFRSGKDYDRNKNKKEIDDACRDAGIFRSMC